MKLSCAGELFLKKSIKKCTFFAILLSCSQSSFGAEAVLVGEGEVLGAPNTVTLTISVDSKCYSTPSDAREKNDQATRKIVDFLNTKIKKKDAYNAVVVNGGYTSNYQTYFRNEIYCSDTFQKQTGILFKTQELENFEELFNEIQNVVYKEFERNAPSVIQQTISYVSMSNPQPSISSERQSQLEQQAMGLAFTDAKNKLKSLFGANIQNLKMVRASEIPPDSPVPIYTHKSSPMAMMAGGMAPQEASAAPVQFDDLRVHKTIYFNFTFDDIALPAAQ